jgi:hypothetical protein
MCDRLSGLKAVEEVLIFPEISTLLASFNMLFSISFLPTLSLPALSPTRALSFVNNSRLFPQPLRRHRFYPPALRLVNEVVVVGNLDYDRLTVTYSLPMGPVGQSYTQLKHLLATRERSP